MDVRFVANDAGRVADALTSVFKDAEEVRVAVAFARPSGLDELPALEQAARSVRSLRFLAGLDFQLTDLSVLEKLHSPPRSESRAFWNRHLVGVETRNFHPKIYIGRRGQEVRALIGSSNFTVGGLKANVEANVLIEGSEHDPVVRQVVDFHDRYWNSPLAVPVTASMHERYSRLQRHRAEAERELRADSSYRSTNQKFDLVVTDALARYGDERGANTWLMVTSSDNYILCERRRMWGDERQSRISRIREGDTLVFYIAGLHQLGMMALVTGPVFEDATPFWEDRLYPYRIPFAPTAVPESLVDFRPLIPLLDLFRGKEGSWGQVLQRSQIELGPHDRLIIREVILKAAGLDLSA